MDANFRSCLQKAEQLNFSLDSSRTRDKNQINCLYIFFASLQFVIFIIFLKVLFIDSVRSCKDPSVSKPDVDDVGH